MPAKFETYRVIQTLLVTVVAFVLGACSGVPTAADEPQAAPPEPAADEATTFSPGDPGWQEVEPELKSEFATAHEKAVGGPMERGVFRDYLPRVGPVAILDYLEQKYPACHWQAHALGKELYAQTGDMMVALQICGSRCTGACMHGVVGEALGGMHGDITEEMEGFCKSDAMAAHKRGNCAHAIGHALLLNSRDLDYALGSCEGFDMPAMRYYCATGVYMQYRDWMVEGELPVQRPTTLYPCDAQSPYPAACYRYMMTFIKDEFQQRSDLITLACLDLPEFERRGCFHGLGMYFADMVKDWIEFDNTMLRDLCSHGTLVDQTMCVEGVIEKLADFDEKIARLACEPLEGEIAEVCNLAATEKMYRLNKPSLDYYLGPTAAATP